MKTYPTIPRDVTGEFHFFAGDSFGCDTDNSCEIVSVHKDYSDAKKKLWRS